MARYKRELLPIYDAQGKLLDGDEFNALRKQMSIQFQNKFEHYAVKAVTERRTLTELLEHSFLQGMVIAQTLSTKES